MQLTSDVFRLLIWIQSSGLGHFLSVAEQQAGLSGVCEYMIGQQRADKNLTAGRSFFLLPLPTQRTVWSDSPISAPDHLSSHILVCNNRCDSSPGLTVIILLQLIVAVMPLRKLSKPIFASAMKSTLKEEKRLKPQYGILNANS